MKKFLLVCAVGVLGVTLWTVSQLGSINNSNTVSVNAPTPGQPVISNVGPSSTKKSVTNLYLSEDNTVLLMGEIGQMAGLTAAELADKTNRFGQKAVFLVIDSPGGSVMDGAMIINAMEASKIPVYTICIGVCASMAAVIHQYGTERLMVDRSVLMFHDAAGQFKGYFSHIKSRLATMDRYIGRFDSYITKRVGLSEGVLQQLQYKELWIDSEDAVKQRFADKIVFINFRGSNKVGDLKKQPDSKKDTTTTDKTPKNSWFEVTW